MSRQNKIVLIFSILAGGLLSLFASSFPDGLEYVAENLGFIEKGNNYLPGLFLEYALPGIANEILASSLAGIFGVLIIFCVIYFMPKIIGIGLKLIKAVKSLIPNP